MLARLLSVALLATTAAACAPSLATMAPARTVPAGHLQVTTSLEASDTSGGIRERLEEAVSMSNEPGPMTRAELRRAVTATSMALVQPPALGFQLSATYGLSRRFEVGARLGTNTLRGHARWQFLRVSPGLYGALGVGISGHLYGLPIQHFVDDMELHSYTRVDVDVPLSFGYSNRWLHLWAGPKVVLSTYDASVRACLREREGRCTSEATAQLDGTAAYVGGQVGIALGYQSVWLAFELTVMRVGTDGRIALDAMDRQEELALDEDGMVLSPAAGLITWF